MTFTVGRGEVFGFLGPNGAGKTTTIKMLTGLVRADDRHAATWPASTSRRTATRSSTRIGYMSQLFSLYHDLTVDENIEFAAGLREVTGERFARRRDVGAPHVGTHRARQPRRPAICR